MLNTIEVKFDKLTGNPLCPKCEKNKKEVAMIARVPKPIIQMFIYECFVCGFKMHT